MITQGRASSQVGSLEVMTAYNVGAQSMKKTYACSLMYFNMVVCTCDPNG